MSKDVVDLPAVRAGMDTIERVLREHPEVRERTEAMLAGRLEGQTEVEAMAKAEKGGQGEGAQIGVRLSQDMLDRIDALIPYLRGIPAHAVLGREITRSLAARYVLAKGLDAVEEEAAKAGMLARPAPTPVKPVQPVSSLTAAPQATLEKADGKKVPSEGGTPTANTATKAKKPSHGPTPGMDPYPKKRKKPKAGQAEPAPVQIVPSPPGTPQYQQYQSPPPLKK